MKEAVTFFAWYCRRCGRLLKTEPEGVYPRRCACPVPMLPSGPTRVTRSSARVLFHPKLLARHAAEIAQRQGGRIGRDACGRPFVLAADPLTQQGGRPLTEAPAVGVGGCPDGDGDGPPLRWLIQKLRALRWPRPSVDEARRT